MKIRQTAIAVMFVLAVAGCAETPTVEPPAQVVDTASATPAPEPSPTPSPTKTTKPAKPKPTKTAEPSPEPTKTEKPTPQADPRFDTCGDAVDAGFGPYSEGDTEYDWYEDRDGDGVVCES